MTAKTKTADAGDRDAVPADGVAGTQRPSYLAWFRRAFRSTGESCFFSWLARGRASSIVAAAELRH